MKPYLAGSLIALCLTAASTGDAQAADACAGNPCARNGDASATCTDQSTSYTCGCTVGYINTGISCVTGCTSQTTGTANDPCNFDGPGTCTVTGASTWTCSCAAGYVSNGATRAA